MESGHSGLDSLVAFRNSQGTEARGSLMHLTRETVVFEVYNPYSIVQLSEVLRDLRVLRGDRTIYAGRAVVSSIVSTGVMLIVSATLVDAWSDLVGIGAGQPLRDEIQRFIFDWDLSHNIRPSYQVAVGNVSSFLSEVSRWLNQVETTSGPGESAPVQREFTLELESGLDGKLGELFGKFEREASQVQPDESPWHKAYARRQVHPLMLVSPFIHRTYTKPLGYAGDYEMVNMILRDRLEGPSTYARLLNSMILRSDGAQAHRNRVERLVEYLKTEAHRVAPRAGCFASSTLGAARPGRSSASSAPNRSPSAASSTSWISMPRPWLILGARSMPRRAKAAGGRWSITFTNPSTSC